MQVLDSWSREAVLEALDNNATDSVASWASWDGMDVVRDAAWTYTMSRVPFPLFNAFMKPRLADAVAHSYVEMSLALARRNNVPVTWWTGACPCPDSLGRTLLSSGFLKAETVTGMAGRLALTDLSHHTPLDIREVHDEHRLAQWCEVVCPAHEVGEPFRDDWRQVFRAAGFGKDAGWRHFVGYVGGDPVAASSSYVDAGVVSLANVAVEQDYRGWGFGHDIISTPLSLARDAGVKIAAIWASDRGRPVFEKMGFAPLCIGEMYLWAPEQ